MADVTEAVRARGPRRWVRAARARLQGGPEAAVDERHRRPGRSRWVTILHSDIVASTRLADAAGPAYPSLLVRHRDLIAAAVERRGGRFMSHAGDGTMAVFDRAEPAVRAAVEAQRALGGEAWPDGLAPRVRMGVHTGPVYEVGGEPVGVAIHHGARIMSVAAAGQVVVSPASAVAATTPRTEPSPEGFGMVDAGWHELRDLGGPVRLTQVVADGVTIVLPDEPRRADVTVGADGTAEVTVALGAC